MNPLISEFLRQSSLIWTLLHILILFMFIYVPRYSKKKTAVISFISMGALCIINFLLSLILGRTLYGQVIIFTLVIPSFIFFFIMAKYRDWRFVFTFCVVDTISAEIFIASMLLDMLAGNTRVVMFIVRLLAFPVLEYLVVKKLRKPYMEIQESLKKGWATFAVVSILFYVLLLIMTSFPSLITERKEDIPIMVLLLILMPLMYFNIFQVLRHQNKLHAIKREQELLNLHSGFMEQRIQQTRETEERIRIERHDLRHRLNTISEMLQKGEYDLAKEYIAASCESFENTSSERYCSNPVLDAVFSSYFKLATSKGIAIESHLAVPEELHVDAVQLSTAIANALENAINACAELDEGKRVIKCKCVNRPQLMFQISNPFKGEIIFDASGNPVSAEKEHGIGTRSILNFCEKNGAFADFKAEDNWFYLRIVLPKE